MLFRSRESLLVQAVLAASLASCVRQPKTATGGDGAVKAVVSDSSEVAKDVYPSRVEINVEQFEKNLKAAHDIVGPGVKVCAVLKGNAYGHGVDVLMPSVLKVNPYAIGITNNGEARVAREAGFKNRILRLRLATAKEIEAAVALDMEEMAGSLENMKVISDVASRAGKTIRVHVAINSAGMSRNGIELATTGGKQEALAMIKLPGIEVVGIMTHFPTGSRDDMRRGAQRFKEEADWLVAEGKLDRAKVLFHAASSTAMQSLPEARFDMVRPGGFIYGEASTPGVARIMRVRTEVASVMKYPAGNTVSYGRTFTLERDSRLANVPLGWSDGFGREFSNAGSVLIRGKKFPVRGLVTMNTILVDVTDDPSVAIGDEVVIAGRQGDASIAITEFARGMNTMGGVVTMTLGGLLPKFPVRGSP